ncbi:hypothetical protein D9M69_564420 [compost metagenome]
MRRTGVEVHRHRHGARGHPRGAAQPHARVEHIGHGGEAAEVERSGGFVAHPQRGAAGVAAAVPRGGDGTLGDADVVAFDPLHHRGHVGFADRVGCGHVGRGQLVHAPGFAARGRHGGGGEHGLACLHDLHHPMLGGSVGAGCPCDHFKRTIGQRSGVVHRERHRLAQQGWVLQHGAERGGRRDATKRPDHVGVGGRSRACEAPLTERLQGDG